MGWYNTRMTRSPSKSKTQLLQQHAKCISLALAELYPDAHCALVHTNPFQLLIATILSAQCTDKTVNKVTPGLFKRYPGPAAMAQAT